MLPITRNTTYRVRYADTDQMGVVYYGNYGRFYEIGRAEMVREVGFPYVEMEKNGVMMPVYSVEAKYRAVLRYDELITIETRLEHPPTARIEFAHRIFSEEGSLAHEATVVLVFMDMKTNKLVRAPKILTDALAAFH
jgi:acyl-CoA thioester hydrolase